jgi:succinoglycan biosynthesis protein ExoA
VSAAPARPITDLVTVLIPARNEVAAIDACLDSVLGQDYPNLQVVIVDNGSRDGTAERVLRRAAVDPRVELVRHPVASIPGALNAGLRAARGRWLVRIDAHSTVAPDYVARAVARLREGRWVGVGGRKDAVARTPTGKAIATVLGSPLAVGGSTYHHGTAVQTVDHIPFGAYPTERLRDIGGWREDIANNEDFELDQRMRRFGELLFDPALRIDWQCRERVADLFGQYRRYGTGKPAVARAHPGSVRPRHLLPPGLVVWLGTSAVVATVVPRAAAAMVAPYAVAVAASSAAVARRCPDGARRGAVPAALVAMQVGWGIGFWQGAARLLRRPAGEPRTAAGAAPGPTTGSRITLTP